MGMNQDEKWMAQALSLAERGAGKTDPNPLVGAVIVRDGQLLGQGWHRAWGGLHAEREALADCREDPRGATAYVTLEPCCHWGKTPPCTEALIEAGISRVVVGVRDPNPLVAGKGISQLRTAGIQVDEGVLEKECEALNRPFFHFIRTGRPYLVLKYAMTLDGKIATRTGASRWITGPEARQRVHRDRNRYTAILVGVGTVLADDPQLTCRLPGGRDPVRVICDSRLRTPLTAHVVTTARQVPTWIATCCKDPERQAPYLAAGCRVLELPEREGRVDLEALLEALGKENLSSVLLEGGAELAGAALAGGLVQHLQAYIAPKLFGGRQAPGPIGGVGVELPAQAPVLQDYSLTRYGQDILLEGELECSRES